MGKQDLKLNFGTLEGIADDLKSYRRSLSKVSRYNQRFIKELGKVTSKGIKAVEGKYKKLQVEMEECLEELRDLETIFTDYCEDMTTILPPINRSEEVHIGKWDIKLNLKSIDSACQAAEHLKTLTGLTDSPSFWLSEEEKAKERLKMQSNYRKMEGIRNMDAVDLVTNLNSKKAELWRLYNEKIVAFENKDDEYAKKAKVLYKKYSNGLEYVVGTGKLIGGSLSDFNNGCMDNIVDTLKGMLVQLYVKPVKAQAAVIDMTLTAIGVGEGQWGKQVIEDEIAQGKMLLKDPFLIVEGMAQGANDALENKGIAYATGYVGTEIAKDLLIKKIATGEISLGKAKGNLKTLDDIRYQQYWDDLAKGKYDIPYGMNAKEYS